MQTEDSCAPMMEAPPEPQASDSPVGAKERSTVVFKPLAKLGTMNPALSSLAKLVSLLLAGIELETLSGKLGRS